MDKQKTILVSIVVGCLMIAFIFLVQFQQEKVSYVLLDGITGVKYENQTYSSLATTDFIGQTMKIYNQTKYVDTYKIYKNLDGRLKYNDYLISQKFLGLMGNIRYDVAFFSIHALSQAQQEVLSDVLKKHKIAAYTELTINQQVDYDVDSDGTQESIISVSNYSFGSKDQVIFNFVYVVKDGEISYLVEEMHSKEDGMFMGQYEIGYLLSFSKRPYDIILTYADGDENSHKIYRKQNDDYQKVM